MHISLDSALGRQRRLNSVGESITQIAPDPAAAYSLRSLTGSDPKVVRVRRDSDNDEQDFTASEVSSGALVDYVNSQVTKPLDVRELQSDGRTGDFVIAKAAYSLRSLGDRQATTLVGDVPLDEDTVQAPSGKYVVQVRRSSDNRIKSFTADEVADGTLVSFVNENQVHYASDYSSGLDSWSLVTSGWTGSASWSHNAANDNRLAVTATATPSGGKRPAISLTRPSNILTGQQYSLELDYEVISGTPVLLGNNFNGADYSHNETLSGSGTATIAATEFSASTSTAFVYFDGENHTFEISIQAIRFKSTVANGFVRALYDQSVSNQAGTAPTGRHAIQNDSAKQASIVTNGALNTSGGLEFDGTDDVYSITSLSFENKPLCVISLQDLQTSTSRLIIGNSSNDRGVAFKTNRTRHHFSSGTIDVDSSNLGAQSGLKLNTVIHDGTTNNPNVKAFRNGVELVDSAPSGNQGQANTSTPANQIGAKQSSGFLSGTLKELLIYDTDQTDNRGAFEANIAEHYNISGIPAEDNQVNGFVETWYDQSGNSRDAIQATATEQPKIIENGNLILQNGEAIIKFDGTDDSFSPVTISSSSFPVSVISLSSPAVTNSTMGIYGIAGQSGGFYKSTALFSIFAGSRLDSSVSAVADNDFIRTDIFNGSSSSLSVNGTETTGTIGTDTSALTKFEIGNSTQSGNSVFNGSIKEIILYLSDQSGNRPNIESNIANHYGITLS